MTSRFLIRPHADFIVPIILFRQIKSFPIAPVYYTAADTLPAPVFSIPATRILNFGFEVNASRRKHPSQSHRGQLVRDTFTLLLYYGSLDPDVVV